MEEKNTKKNHWTQSKVDNANKKINQNIYKRRRQAGYTTNITRL